MSRFFNHPSKPNIYGLFNDSFPPILDGVTLTVQNYVKWLKTKGKTPCVVTPWNPVAEPVDYDVLKFFSLPIHSRHPYRYGYPKLDPFIWRKLRKTDFKLVHAHCPFSSGRLGVYVKKTNGVPLIGTFHSKYREDLKHSFKHTPWMVGIIMKRILDFFNACDEVWIPQAQVEETVREYGFRGPVTVVENGNDFAALPGSDLFAYKENAKKALGMDPNEIALLFVGQHIWEKGLGMVVETLKRLGHELDFRMNFIGTGYAFDEIKRQISEAKLDGKVKLNGVIQNRDELSRYYAASDLFLFPSFYDNAPLVVREAAALGTPSAILRGSTASEVISDHKNGFLVDNDPAQLETLVRQLSADRTLLHEVAVGARNTLVRSWEDVVGEVSDRYDSLIKRMS